MGSRYRMVDIGVSFKKIMNGRHWVGRVYPIQGNPTSYRGKIGKTESALWTTEHAAFEDVVAKHLGYESAGQLHAHNRQVQGSNRQRRAVANQAVHKYLNASNITERMDAIDELVEQIFSGVVKKAGK